MAVCLLVFLDASKAFDRVNHRILFMKLGNRGTPTYIIRILSFWYANQQMCIRWGGTYSTSFNVYYGVRQGRILSPSVAGLSKLLRICELFGASHDMIFNQKSASVYFISKH